MAMKLQWLGICLGDCSGGPENSSGFHAPQEALRILVDSINFARKGQLAVRSPVQPP